MVEIVEAGLDDMTTVKALFQEYQQLLGVSLCFQGFDTELATLPGSYSKPAGAILLATRKNQVCGCVGFRPLSKVEAELKRLFVQPQSRGTGVGRALFNEAMSRVKAIGYQTVVLDTLPSMQTAKSMYEDYGFREMTPYYINPVEGVKYYRYEF